MNVEEIYQKFLSDFWSKQCCPHPCINTQDEDLAYLAGAEALYKFIQSPEETTDKVEK